MTEISRRGALTALSAAAGLTPTAARPNPPVVISRIRKDYADGPFGQIHYRNVKPAASTNLPLLCFHVSPISSIVYENFLLEIGDDRWAIAADTPGYGGSAPPPQPENWRKEKPDVPMSDYAKAMIQLLDTLGVAQTDLMGEHTGSNIALEVARTIPDRVRRVVLVGAPVFSAEEITAFYKLWFTPPEPPIFLDYLKQHLNGYGALRYSFRNVTTEGRFAQFMNEWLRSYPREHWAQSSVTSYAPEFGKNLAGLNQPVLLLNTLNDSIPEQTKRAAKLLKNPQSRYVEIPGWTHGAVDGHAPEMAKMVREFLA